MSVPHSDGPQARDEALARLRGVGGGVDLEFSLQVGDGALQIREAPGVARAERFRVLGLQLREPLLEPALLLVGGQAALAPELLRVALALLAAGRRGVVPGVAAGPARQRYAAAHDLTREAVI